MLSNKTFGNLNLFLQKIETMPKVFGGISVILSGDLLQLPSVQQQQIFMKQKRRNQAFQGFFMGRCFPFVSIDRCCLSKQWS